MFWNTDDPYLYARITRDNRLMAGGRDERFSNRASRNLYEKKAAQLCKDIGQVFPKIEFKPEFSWSGTFGKTRDSLPYIGKYPKTPFVYYALGFGGNGITFSQIAAEMIRDMILGRLNADAEIFSFERKDR
jgi:glycine/D-amino acid oxidase-like deaminating enzyme